MIEPGLQLFKPNQWNSKLKKETKKRREPTRATTT